MNTSFPQAHGVIGGVTATEIRDARAWRNYEIGLRDSPPENERPEWLTMPDAAHTTEVTRLLDEFSPEDC